MKTKRTKRITVLLLSLIMLLSFAVAPVAAAQEPVHSDVYTEFTLEGVYLKIAVDEGIANLIHRGILDYRTLLSGIANRMASFDYSELVSVFAEQANLNLNTQAEAIGARFVDITADDALFNSLNGSGFASLQAAIAQFSIFTAQANAELNVENAYQTMLCCGWPSLQFFKIPVYVDIPGHGFVLIGWLTFWMCVNCGALW